MENGKRNVPAVLRLQLVKSIANRHILCPSVFFRANVIFWTNTPNIGYIINSVCTMK